MSDLIPDLVLQDNTSQRLPCVIIVDGSTSMKGKAIKNLNEGLSVLERELKADDIASMRVQILVIRIGAGNLRSEDAEVLTDWTEAIDFSAPKITANGMTPLGKGVKLGLKKIEAGPNSGRLQFTENTAVEPMTIVSMVQNNPAIFRLQNNDQLSFTMPMDSAEQRFSEVNKILQQLLTAV